MKNLNEIVVNNFTGISSADLEYLENKVGKIGSYGGTSRRDFHMLLEENECIYTLPLSSGKKQYTFVYYIDTGYGKPIIRGIIVYGNYNSDTIKKLQGLVKLIDMHNEAVFDQSREYVINKIKLLGEE